MRRSDLMPVAMGTMTGSMALWMLHGALTGQGAAPGMAFVLAHLAVAGLVILATAFGLNHHFPILARLSTHRPSFRHLLFMLASAATTALLIHLVHGGPVWT